MTHNASDSKPPPPYDARNMSEARTEPALSEPRYLYYRVYCPDGAIPSKTAFDARNPYSYIVIQMHPNLSLSTDRVVIVGPAITDGATPDSAFILVFGNDLTEEENAAIARIDLSSRCEEEPKYLYYRLFTQTDEDRPKVSFNPNKPTLGRVERILVSPPHSTTTIRHLIAKVEGRPIYRYSEFYENLSAQTTMGDGKYLALMEENSIGLTEEEPIILVQRERRPGLYNRPVKLLVFWSDFFPMGSLAYTDAVLVDGKYGCKRGGCSADLFPGQVKFLDE
ncbi:hypothetical protein MSAN_01596300 [Mycena sanguinolenta]|uniref:Uncharacterized protein n=1 Tax=Mycena sanguinolenta TaxID=230812 RepID=A0A8H6Y4H9_9AGAR|nr:hypothetical protein MSAN_01596300 [Mycena sanguinolenta]